MEFDQVDMHYLIAAICLITGFDILYYWSMGRACAGKIEILAHSLFSFRIGV